jgi:hypothetical protein
MIGAVDVDQQVFGLSVELIDAGVHYGVLRQAFELRYLCLQGITPGLRVIHGIDLSHERLSFLVGLGIPFYLPADQLGIPLEKGEEQAVMRTRHQTNDHD